MTTAEYIQWARENCTTPVAQERSSFDSAREAYDEVDARLGDEAEGNEFLTKALWMEITIRLAQLGWTVEEFEDERWPVPNTKAVVAQLIREGTR